MKLKEMKNKAKIAVLCGIFLAVLLVIGGVVFAWKSTFKTKKSDEETSSVPVSSDEPVNDSSEDTSVTSSATETESSATSESTEEPSGSQGTNNNPTVKKNYGTIKGDGYEGTKGTGKYNEESDQRDQEQHIRCACADDADQADEEAADGDHGHIACVYLLENECLRKKLGKCACDFFSVFFGHYLKSTQINVFAQDLPAHSARITWIFRILAYWRAGDRDRREFFLAFAECFCQCDTLRAEARGHYGGLDIAASVDLPILRQKRRSHSKRRERSIRVFPCFLSFF